MNYFHYFSEIEDCFSRRRGSLLLLSTLDWALIESWREAGIPLEAVLRGIEAAFDKHDAQRRRAGSRTRRINGLAWCAQAVMQAAEQAVEAATGAAVQPRQQAAESGFEPQRVHAFLQRNAAALEAAAQRPLAPKTQPATQPEAHQAARQLCAATALRLRELAAPLLTDPSEQPPALDELDRTLTVLEEKLFAALHAAASEAELVDLKAQAERELAPYRSRMGATQLRQVQQQFLHKRLLELYGVPRLSLFYMGVGE